MIELASSTVLPKRRPVISEKEVATLAADYGTPIRRTYQMKADEYLRKHRFSEQSDRRAEVVFAIEDPMGRIWVHAKRHYPSHIYRLPSGGINWSESIKDALFREVAEETAFSVEVKQFIGVVDYQFHDQGCSAHFASYIFHLGNGGGQPRPHASENISEFRAILPTQLSGLAADLRNLIGDRHGWGQFRALSHDLVYEHLTG